MTTDQFLELTGATLPTEFEFVRNLGQGTMARVFLIRNKPLKRLAALKVLDPVLAQDATGKKRFVREAQAAARISHDCVTTVYGVGELMNGTPYIEMQYVDGINLAQHLRSHGNLAPAAAERVLRQLVSALAAAHENGIIHRDVKPANVLVENDSDRVYLTDFGVARIRESGSEAVTKLTREGDRFGDPTYMSPEQLRGETVTEQTDVYSLGVLGYELLTGTGPYGECSGSDTVAAHLRRHPFDLSAARPDIPAGLSNALKSSLAKRPENRPRASDLDALIAETGDVESQNEFRRFMRELQQRKVYRAAATYAAATFILLQAMDLIIEPLNVPDWIYRVIVVGALAGFPLAVALAWIFDLREGRLIRTGESSSSPVSRTILQVLGLGFSAALSASVAWWLLAGQ